MNEPTHLTVMRAIAVALAMSAYVGTLIQFIEVTS